MVERATVREQGQQQKASCCEKDYRGSTFHGRMGQHLCHRRFRRDIDFHVATVILLFIRDKNDLALNGKGY
jgi:hypothetical protein